jgi:hypothetical protein
VTPRLKTMREMPDADQSRHILPLTNGLARYMRDITHHQRRHRGASESHGATLGVLESSRVPGHNSQRTQAEGALRTYATPSRLMKFGRCLTVKGKAVPELLRYSAFPTNL